jgi:hypothetical protein
LLYDKVWKFAIKNIYPKYIKVYTDIDPTVNFVFSVNKIDRENSEKLVSQDKFEVNQKLSKELNMFLLLRITVMCTSCLS